MALRRQRNIGGERIGMNAEAITREHHDECECDICMSLKEGPHPDGCDCGSCGCDSHSHGVGDLHAHGVYDPTFGIPELRTAEEFVTSGGRWTDGGGYTSSLGSGGGTITWSLAGSGLDDATGQFFSGLTVDMATFLPFDFAATLQRAFDAWSEYADIQFVQVADQGGDIGATGSPTIRVVGAYIDGQDGANTLARAFYPTSHPAGGDIVFDSGNTNFYQTEHYFFLTALHEIGHSIGLGHEQTSNAIAIMNPVINTNLDGLQADDIAGAIAVYGEARSPDLVAGNLAMSDTALMVGENVTVTFDITNAGDGTAVDTTAGLFLSNDATITTGDTLLSSVLSTQSNTAGAVDGESIAFAVPDVAPGTYYIGVIADLNDDEAGESNEGNNVSGVVQITIEAADPYPDVVVIEDNGDIRTTTFNTNGTTKTEKLEDISNSRVWSEYIKIFDEQEQLELWSFLYDDGRIREDKYESYSRIESTMNDAGNRFTWADTVTLYDEAGQISKRSINYDNGGRKEVFFENGKKVQIDTIDQNSEYSWVKISDSLNSNFEVIERETLYDDGRIAKIIYDDGSILSSHVLDSHDYFFWVTIEKIYNNQGSLTKQLTKYDDGRAREDLFQDNLRIQSEVVDEEDNFAWDAYVDTYSIDGQRDTRLITYDDGTQRLIEYG